PLMLCLGFEFLWRGLTAEIRSQKPEARSPAISLSRRLAISPSLRLFIFGGIFLGLSAYTYLSSRAIPILLIAFVIYLALFARDRMRGRWRNLFICFAIAIVVALPLAITVLTNPDLQFRVSEVSDPLDQALKGDTQAIMANIPLAFGMFTDRGDNTVRDNLPDRPVFPEPIGQALLIFGFVIALSKFNQPRYALALIWLGSMLVPSIVTSGAPNFTRTLGALPMAFALPAIGLEWLSMWPLRMIAMPHQQKLSRIFVPIAIVFLIGVFAINAASTFDDYFNKWPNHSETQFVFQADFAAIAKDIDANNVMDVSVGGLSNDTLDDDSLRLLLQRKDVRVRWFDSGSPISSGGAIVEGYNKALPIYIPSMVPVSSLFSIYLDDNRCLELFVDNHFRHYQLRCEGVGGISPKARSFNDTALLQDTPQNFPDTILAGDRFQFTTTWIAQFPIDYPRRVFVHLVDPRNGLIVAQHDGLDAPTKFWGDFDQIIQVHTLTVPLETVPGIYEIWIGLYDPSTGQRVLQTDSAHSEPPSDQYLLGTIQVAR
ncbi:MAG TPA: hypothetical protein VFF70_09820, partial [Anaerolineae bacterium]|nr:hypothetical protein [Anaerolineae bacterium]